MRHHSDINMYGGLFVVVLIVVVDL